MIEPQREFLDELLATPGPAGHEARVQRVFADYLEPYADEVRIDAFGNAVAVAHGANDGPAVALAAHADEIGYIVNSIDESGYLHLDAIGTPGPAVSAARHVVIHAADGPVPGVIGAKPIHLRGDADGPPEATSELHVEVGAADREEATELVQVGDPVTVARQLSELAGDRLAAPGMDNRAGVWSVAEAFRRAVETGTDATVYAVSTIQEEISKAGARIVGTDLQPDALVVVDVTFATDSPDVESHRHGDIDLGGGPAIGRGSANHPAVVDALRAAARDGDLPVQLDALGSRTGTDADVFFDRAAGIPSTLVSVPSRYMHTPVEVIDRHDLDVTADLLATFAVDSPARTPFVVGV